MIFQEMIKVLKFEEFARLYENTISEPVGLAILGAPAGGKSYTVSKIKDIADDARLTRAISKGVNLSVDVLRDEFLSKDPIEQLKGFTYAFILMRDRAAANPKEFSKWYEDIKNLWIDKISSLAPELKVSIKDNELYFGDTAAVSAISTGIFKKIDAKKIISSLDKYNDYKRVVRFFQTAKQEDAVTKTIDVSYDEAGDEPTKIIGNLDRLHQKGYVTDVFLIHPSNVASNLVQNYYRVVTGGDGGRDSSAAIMGAYKEIEKNKNIYTDNAEKVIDVRSATIAKDEKIKSELKAANVKDDKERGDLPIDVLAIVDPRPPQEAYNAFMKELKNDEQKNLYTALLKFAASHFDDLPTDAKSSLNSITKDMSNDEAKKILQDASDSKKYVFKFGGITPEFMKKVNAAL